MKFAIVVIHQNDAQVNSAGDRIEVVSTREVLVTPEDFEKIMETEQYLERLLGMRVHLNTVE